MNGNIDIFVNFPISEEKICTILCALFDPNSVIVGANKVEMKSLNLNEEENLTFNSYAICVNINSFN